MAQLPVELITMIVSFSSRDDFPRLSTVSPTWQLLVECHTMHAIHVKSTELHNFSKIFAHHNRRAALTKLDFDVVLPPYSDEQCTRFETHQDKQQNNEAITDAIQSLFLILHSWEEEVGMLGNPAASSQGPVLSGHIWLILSAYSPTDSIDRDDETRRDGTQRLLDEDDLFEDRYERSMLRISRCDELQIVSRICCFETGESCYERHIEGASLAGVASKLPNLESIGWWVNDNEKFYDAVRRQHRLNFAQSLAALPVQSLKKVTLNVYNAAPRNHHFRPPSTLIPSTPSSDHLSLALHTLSQSPNLTYLCLGGDIVLSPSFFWPQDPACPTPFWPHLQYLYVGLNMTTPEGNWLYKRDPEDFSDHYYVDPSEDFTLSEFLELANHLGMGTDFETLPTHSSDTEVLQTFKERLHSLLDGSESEQRSGRKPDDQSLYSAMAYLDGSEPVQIFRKSIDGEQLNPMLMAMARAARQMPVIRCMRLDLNRGSFGAFKVQFLNGPSRTGSCNASFFHFCSKVLKLDTEVEEKIAKVAKKEWFVKIRETQWRVPEDLQAAWKSVGLEDEDDVPIHVVQRV